jgi:hypothetical protein
MNAIERRLATLEARSRAMGAKAFRIVFVHDTQSQDEQDAAIDRQLAEQGIERDDPGTTVCIVRFCKPIAAAA